ncbi:LysR family transcriptional regulator [Alicyclobacillus sp. ALC3]|uniref:LysR family transcriptional regulator n=1 Tax=Alicyclobacillus sp. ALC3 TaxID=2796143 RepID=UPI0023780FCC|nr:LysR family transcriptional regulator [Alicyclobacillus sp. ALC3]WDL99128.1 LysR family transcriptional regulator [Alicyclobacillus sp. ALC3]
MDQQLLVFVTVAEERSFTRAAEKLHISQPAISQHVQNLEQRLDVTLLDRTNKYVRLNKAGDVVYHYAKDILGLYEQMSRLVQDLKEDASGPLSIGASFTFGEYVLPHVIAEFRREYPKISPSITVENTQTVADQVAHGQLDVGVVEGSTIRVNGIHSIPFAEDTVVVVAASSHPLALQSVVTPEELSAETWIVREKGSGTREITDHVFEAYGIHPTNLIEYSSTQVIKESVEAELGITILSKWSIRKELTCNTLQVVSFSDSPITRQFSIVVRKSDFETKSVKLFQEFLQLNYAT